MGRISLTPIDNTFAVKCVEFDSSPFSPELAEEVDSIWEAATSRNPNLFDGTLLSVIRADGNELICQPLKYRWIFAQAKDPSLRAQLNIRAAAVSGVTVMNGKLLFAKRAAHLTQSPGLYELVPSGGLDAPHSTSSVDYKAHLLKELEEESQLSPNLVEQVLPFVLAEDQDEAVVDIFCKILLKDVHEPYVLSEFKAGEYSLLEAADLTELKKRIDKAPQTWVPASVSILEYLNEIP